MRFIPKKYFFKESVFAASVASDLVLLDVEADQYYVLNEQDVEKISPFVAARLPVFARAGTCSRVPAEAGDALQNLLDAGLITDAPAAAKVLEPCHVEPPIAFFEHLQCDEWPTARWHHLATIIVVGLIAHVLMRFLTFSRLLRLIAKVEGGARGTEANDRAVRLARIYYQYRPFLYRSGPCLYDTIAFFLFCRLYGIRPTIVFGVLSDPFEAHCWAQLNGYILNDVPQNIRQYAPIMTL